MYYFTSVLELIIFIASLLFSYLMASACFFLRNQLLPDWCCKCIILLSVLILEFIFQIFSNKILFSLLISVFSSDSLNVFADYFDLYRVCAIFYESFAWIIMGNDFWIFMFSIFFTCWSYFRLFYLSRKGSWLIDLEVAINAYIKIIIYYALFIAILIIWLVWNYGIEK